MKFENHCRWQNVDGGDRDGRNLKTENRHIERSHPFLRWKYSIAASRQQTQSWNLKHYFLSSAETVYSVENEVSGRNWKFSSTCTWCFVQYLDLGYCRLSHLPPKIFRGLKALLRLDLRGNELHHLEPFTFADLRSLDVLLLGHNPLHQLNSRVFRCFYLSAHRFSRTDFFYFGGFLHCTFYFILSYFSYRISLYLCELLIRILYFSKTMMTTMIALM